MSTVAAVREEDYLTTVYEPDCEFDGVLIERNTGRLRLDGIWDDDARRARSWG